MTKTVSSNEAKNRLGALLGYVSDEGGEVVIENRGKPRAVIISIEAYREVQALREHQRREDALAALRALRTEVRQQNQGMTEQEAQELANRFSRELTDAMVERGTIAFERDTHRSL